MVVSRSALPAPGMAFVILIFNNFEDAARLALQLLASQDRGVLIVALDNASTDRRGIGSWDSLLRDDRVRLVLRDVNSGYAKGNNDGIDFVRQCGVDRVVILNPDLVIDDAASLVVRLHRHFDSSEFLCLALTVRGVAPYYTAPNVFSILFPILARQIADRYCGHASRAGGVGFAVGRVHGCAFALRASLFRSVGLFDPDTFLYGEELAVGIVARAHRLPILQAADIEVEHVGQGSSGGRVNALHARWMRESVAMILGKYFGFPPFVARVFARFSVWQVVFSSSCGRGLRSVRAFGHGLVRRTG